MYNHLPFPLLVTIGAALLLLYVLAAGVTYRKRLATILLRGSHRLQVKTPVDSSDRYFAPLIDKPANHPAEQVHPKNANDQDFYEDEVPMPDENESFLLKEAEWVVEQIQDVVDHIASRPANPDEVFTKIRAIVSQYGIFENTEYFDAINNFVAVTVKRDCDLTLTTDDLKALWWTEAA